MVRRKPNIQQTHFEYDRAKKEFACKTCGSIHSELEAIMHLMSVHGYPRIDIILDEPKDE